MKIVIPIILLLIGQTLFSQNFDLTIVVSNIKNLEGNIIVSLYNSPSNFPKKNMEYRSISSKVNEYTVTINFNNLPKGEYAIALFHDKNLDGECNFNFWGVPTEMYAFSNNFKPILSTPSFNDCKINLNENLKVIIYLIE